MNPKVGAQAGRLEESSPTSWLKLPRNPAKSNVNPPQIRTATTQNKPPSTTRLKLTATSSVPPAVTTPINPWKCESEPYDALPITYHTPIYNPPCYFDAKLKQLPRKERVLKIMAYHYALNMQMSLYARSQPQQVLGDPIQPAQGPIFNGQTDRYDKKKASSSSINSDINSDKDDMYISRSGRHVKRRQLYNEVDLSDDEDSEKKLKKIKLEKADECYKTTPTSKKTVKRATNEEIMARSSLFADSPVGNKSARTQAMFSKMKESEKESKKADLEKRKFEETLNLESDDDIITSSNENDKDFEFGEKDFIKRRIDPPKPVVKKGRLATKSQDWPTASTSASGSGVGALSSRPVNGETAVGNKRGAKKKLTNCPICGENFGIKEIEEHASTCGLTSELEIESSIPSQRTDPTRY